MEQENKTLYSQTIGPRGPVLLQDSILHESLETLIHSKILERPLHVKGFGAFGTFKTTHSMKEHTKLSFLQTPGQELPVMTRFSLGIGGSGVPDTSRNIRGFSTKFYANDGIFDLICNHIPVFLIRDGIRFPEALMSLSPSPVNNLPDPESFWVFVSKAPEAINFILWLFSDVGTLKSFRHMCGAGVTTYVWINSEGRRCYVKYHWIPLAGVDYIDAKEATLLAGTNPNIAGEDLYYTIAKGEPVQYELRVQLMDIGDAQHLSFDPLDSTKLWNERQYPLLPVGLLTLNRNPDNYMEQVEKVGFSPSNLLDGAELSDDRVLQARANIYWDSQRNRLGPDFRSFLVNHQKHWSPTDLVSSGIGKDIAGQIDRVSIPVPDNFSQAGEFYHSLSSEAQGHLTSNLASALVPICPKIQKIILGYLYCATPKLKEDVEAKIKVYTP